MNYLSLLTNLKQSSMNTIKPRTYYIPYKSKELAFFSKNRNQSDCFISLNGIWDFKFIPSIGDIPESFWTDGKMETSTQITVPSCIQCEGYDHHQYTNVSYPIPFNPPYVPDENPCAYYKTVFSINKEDLNESIYINFEGVDSCFYIWVNDCFVGYDTVSHANSEFILNDALKVGENTLKVLVVKWCVGTYFEDQDKFRLTGIYRDVFLLKRTKNHVVDIHIDTVVDLENKIGTLNISIPDCNDKITVTVYDRQKNIVTQGEYNTDSFTLCVDNCIFWNAENPYLYTVLFEINGEFIPFKIGFRMVKIENGQIIFNGQNIKLYGVNHHDSNPETGATVSLQNQINDLKLMKEHHINAIRTSHYPKSPEFYELCDEMGFYVMSEADVECHGVVDLYGLNGNKNYNMMADDPQYQFIITDRIKRMVMALRNYTCIFSWSMGNESGYGCNFEKALQNTRDMDKSRLLHYEGLCRDKEQAEIVMKHSDLYSRMYWGKQEVETFVVQNQTVPLLLCEYAHAMGNGPGDLKMYYNLMQKYPNFVGAFVWEWCDHAMLMSGSTKSDKKYGYGGDFGDFPHFSNFCIDGLVYPNRRVHTGLKEYQAIHMPLQLVKFEDNNIYIENILAFSNGADKFDGYYRYSVDGIRGKWNKLELGNLQPYEVKAYPVIQSPEGKVVTLEWTIMCKGDTVPKVHSNLGLQQILLKKEIKSNTQNINDLCGEIHVKNIKNKIEICGDTFRYVYNPLIAGWENIVYKNNELLHQPTQWNIWRVPVDNDRKIQSAWREAGFDRTFLKHYSTNIKKTEHSVKIITEFSFTAHYIQRILSIKVNWAISLNGEIQCNLHVDKDPVFPPLPRFGLCLPMVENASDFTYFGYGPYESYCDKHHASYFGMFKSSTNENFEPYIKPQENGSHFDTYTIQIYNQDNIFEVNSDNGFCFGISPYSIKTLESAKHNHELPISKLNYVYIDYAQNGLGSNSCGPDLAQEYSFDETTFEWDFIMRFVK